MLIFIIGYMGAGKTTLGKDLAARLGYRFTDLDELIESETACSISRYFARFGEAAFREKEREILLSIIKDNDIDTVIATGGGTPCYADNMELMNKAGVTVFLDTPYEILLTRLIKEYKHRPLLKDIPVAKLPEFIKEHMESRRKFYSRAKIRITGDINLQELSNNVTAIDKSS